jgi:hypothetical protein
MSPRHPLNIEPGTLNKDNTDEAVERLERLELRVDVVAVLGDI